MGVASKWDEVRNSMYQKNLNLAKEHKIAPIGAQTSPLSKTLDEA
jgi:hypothetical protein